MFQIVDALVQTLVRMGGTYGPWVAGGVLALVACGIALRVLAWALSRGEPK